MNDSGILTEKSEFRFLVSGDSISKGIVYDEAKRGYSVLNESYVALVGAKLKGIVRNVSRFGSTLIRGLPRLGREIDKGETDVLLLEYGGNDCDFAWPEVAAHPEADHEPQTDLGLFEDALAETIGGLKEKAIVPVLMSLPPLDADRYLHWVSKQDPVAEGNILKWLGSVTKIYWWQERYSSSIARVAEATETHLIDVRGAFLKRPDFTTLLCRDGIHPNERGHQLIADTILDYIARSFSYLLAEGVPALA